MDCRAVLIVAAVGCVIGFWYQQSKLNVMKHTEKRSIRASRFLEA